jgi:hypothetical protein
LADQKRNFERWRKKLPATTQYLVEKVVARILPEFEASGFRWYADVAGGNPMRIGANEIPLQRRQGIEWPTVQLAFHQRGRPWFQIHFAALPETCRRLDGDEGHVTVRREDAIAVEAPGYFCLRRGRWSDYRDGEFGFNCLSLFPVPVGAGRFLRYRLSPESFLDSELDAALELLPMLFDIFDRGIPREWLEHDFGYITPHVMLIHSWKLWDARRGK